ncbi:MAG: ATP-binding cassette domain-containing protein [Bilophila wadsworthia]
MPASLRLTGFALGLTHSQIVRHILVPQASRGILGGIMLAMGRAAEDTAVILLTGVVANAGLPSGLAVRFEALPFFIYYTAAQYQTPEELERGFGASLTLLLLSGGLLLAAWWLHARYQRRKDACSLREGVSFRMTLAARIRRLSVAFHERTILHDITLDIPAEGITVLLGRSGSGKTTFLRALNRLNECLPGCRTSGEAELRLGGGLRPIYAGRTGEAALSDLRRRVGMVFQTPNILPASIRQNMLLPLQLATAFPASEWRERMERSLTEVGLWHDVSSRLREPASILSGGQQQRLCLARTLALEPEILLLDEPTASLDPATTHTIENLLLKLAERYPILLVSHGLPQAQRMASRIVLFGKGRLQGMLSPEELPNEAEMNRFFDGGDAGNR